MATFYECVLLLKSQLSDEESSNTISRFTGLVESKGGTVHHVQKMGRKRMAYEMNKERRAEYVVLFIELPKPSDIAELDRQARIDERVIKSMIVKKDALNYSKNDTTPAERSTEQEEVSFVEGDAH